MSIPDEKQTEEEKQIKKQENEEDDDLTEEEVEIIKKEQDVINQITKKYTLKDFYIEKVFIAEDIDSKKEVIVKKLVNISKDETDAKNALREFSILTFIDHINVVKLLDVLIPEGENFDYLYLIVENKDYNLKDIIKANEFDYQNEKKDFIKTEIHQILLGLDYLHKCKIIHRDMKPSNILVNKYGSIWINDFGIARSIEELGVENKKYITKGIGTLYYHAPELLYEEVNSYDEKVDIWALGCIMLELYTRKTPYFKCDKKKDEVTKWEQLKKIMSVLGKPDKEQLKNMDIDELTKKNIKGLSKNEYTRKPFKELFPDIKDEEALDLLENLLKFNYEERFSTEEALKHKFFDKLPLKSFKIEKKFNGKYEIKLDEFKEIKELKNKDEYSEYQIEFKDEIEYCQKQIKKFYQEFKNKNPTLYKIG